MSSEAEKTNEELSLYEELDSYVKNLKGYKFFQEIARQDTPTKILKDSAKYFYNIIKENQKFPDYLKNSVDNIRDITDQPITEEVFNTDENNKKIFLNAINALIETHYFKNFVKIDNNPKISEIIKKFHEYELVNYNSFQKIGPQDEIIGEQNFERSITNPDNIEVIKIDGTDTNYRASVNGKVKWYVIPYNTQNTVFVKDADRMAGGKKSKTHKRKHHRSVNKKTAGRKKTNRK